MLDVYIGLCRGLAACDDARARAPLPAQGFGVGVRGVVSSEGCDVWGDVVKEGVLMEDGLCLGLGGWGGGFWAVR